MSAGKAEIRARLRARREAVSAQAAALASEELAGHLVALPEFDAATTVAIFCAFRAEIDPMALLDLPGAAGKRICLPRTHRRPARLTFHSIPTPPGATRASVRAGLVPGAYGILEPTGPEVPLHALELVVVPALAFDRQGYRLGWGGGYYDRVLAELPARAVTVGVGFAFQVVDELPREPHDLPVMRVLTPSGACEAI
jgi:5-formyltetrahydrofolate cyclo-ligase